MYVYLVTNKVNGKRYIGQTINSIQMRWNQHTAHSKNLKRSGVLCFAMRKYGIDNFSIKILSKCESMEEMNHREKYYIKLFNTLSPNGYNLDSGGKNNLMHAETKKKISKAKKGKKLPPFSEEHRNKISESNKGRNKGIPLSEETKHKISLANRGENHPMFGKKQSDKNKMATSKANKGNTYWVGRNHKEESKEKMSINKKGKFAGLKNPFFGKKHNRESLQKMSKANDKTKIKILCINNNIVYDSKNAAEKALNVGRNQISKVISGEIAHVKGFVFKKA